jgi:hypothetical protein
MRASDIQYHQSKVKESFRKSLERAEADDKTRYSDLLCESMLLEGGPSALIVEEAERRDVQLIR